MDTYDKISCRVCGKFFASILKTHLHIHNLTKEDYLQKFPEAPIHSQKRKDQLKERGNETARKRYNATWENSEDRKKQQEVARRMGMERARACKESPELLKKRADVMRNNRNLFYKENPEKLREYGLRGLNKQLHDKTSKVELEFKMILESLSIGYEYQYRIAFYLVDFFIPSKNVVFEIQGDYWHANPEIYREYDSIQQHNVSHFEKKRRIIEASGYQIVEVWESDIRRNSESVVELIKYYCG